MKMTPTQLAEAISRFVNGSSDDKLQEVADIMAKDHPTLQQLTMKLACKFIENIAEKTRTDHRNQQSHKIAKQMIAGHKAAAIQEIVEQDGDISKSLRDFINDKSLPSKNLPLV